MRLEDKMKLVKSMIKEAGYPLRYQNFFKFLESYDNRKQHRELDKAIEDLEGMIHAYPDERY